ncbi:MAG: prepilin-type N-terminal cleavage/methylation domain-containing protein [Methylobacter sp.]|nr:prepilin-type N-terminal cleavage/methylation domain-containing protein [Methylobacter sp.]
MKKQSGFTLIELMIALVIGLIIIAATIGIYITTIRGSSDTIKFVRLNHDLESVMSLMTNDIRRAGYWAGAIAGADSRENPFTSETTNVTNIQLRNLAAPTTAVTTGNCILYTYDANGDGVVDVNEYYGFRRNGSTINMRLTGTATDPADCTNGSWEENIAGNQITITALSFSLDNSKCLNVTTTTSFNSTCAVAAETAGNLNACDNIAETRQVTVTLNGQLADDPSVKKSLTNIIKTRNDRVFRMPPPPGSVCN